MKDMKNLFFLCALLLLLCTSCRNKISEEEILGSWMSDDYHYTFEIKKNGVCVIHNIPDTILYYKLPWNDLEYNLTGELIDAQVDWEIYNGLDLDQDDEVWIAFRPKLSPNYVPNLSMKCWVLNLHRDLFGRKEHEFLFYAVSHGEDYVDDIYKFHRMKCEEDIGNSE